MVDIEKLFERFPSINCGEYILREITEDDTDGIYEIYSDSENIVYDRKKPFVAISEAVDYINRFKNKYIDRESIRWGIAHKSDNKVIGVIAINLIDPCNQRCSIGYILNKKHWRKGIMSSCTKELIQFIFNEIGFHRIAAQIHPANTASISLVESLGFHKEGILKDYSFNIYEDKFEDRAAYSLLNNTKI